MLLVSLLISHTSLVRGIVHTTRAGDKQLTREEIVARLTESEEAVSLALVINNMSGHRLSLEEVDLSCGVFSSNSSMPDTVPPATTAVVFIEKVGSNHLQIFQTFRHKPALLRLTYLDSRVLTDSTFDYQA